MQTKSYMLGEEEIKTIGDLKNKYSLGSASAALRIIIRQWAKGEREVTIPIIGTIKDDKIVFGKGE